MCVMNPVEKAARAVGGQSELASSIGVSPQAVHKWIKGRAPADKCPDIERLTNGAVRCEELRPDIDWSVLRKGP